MLAKLVGRAMVRHSGAVALLIVVGLGPAAAQSNTQWDSLYDRIIRLEHRLNALENGGNPQSIVTTDPATSASQSLRIDQIENDLRTLLGQVQNLAFQVQQLTERVRKFSEDTEYRIEQLESGNRSFNDNTSSTKRTANNDDFELPDYGDLSSLEQYPQENTSEPYTQQDGPTIITDLPQGTQSLGTIPQEALNDDTTTLSAVPEAVTSQPLDDPTGTTGADTLYKTSYSHLLKRRFGAAEAGFTKFLKQHAKHELAGNAQYWLGETYYARGQYKKAAQAFLTGYRDYSKSPKAPDSMLKLGMSLRQLGQTQHACQTFAQIKGRFPKASADVKRLAAREHKRAGCGS